MAYNHGIEKSVAEMTQAEKMQLRILQILEGTQVAWGDQANTIGSVSNQLRLLKNNASEAGIIFGQLWVPVLEYALPILNGMTIALKEFLSTLADFMGIKLDPNKYSAGYNEMADEMYDLAEGYDNATEAAKAYENQLLGFDKVNKLSESSSSASGSASGIGGIDLTQDILDATANYEKVWQEAYDNMRNDAEFYAQKFAVAFEPLTKAFEAATNGDFYTAGYELSGIVVNFEDILIDAIDNTDWDMIGSKIGDFIAGIRWEEIIAKGFKLKFDIWKAIADVWFGMASTAPLETAILSALALMKFSGISVPTGVNLFNAPLSGGTTGSGTTGKGTGLLGHVGTISTGLVIGAVAGEWIAENAFGEEDVIYRTLDSIASGEFKGAFQQLGRDIMVGIHGEEIGNAMADGFHDKISYEDEREQQENIVYSFLQNNPVQNADGTYRMMTLDEAYEKARINGQTKLMEAIEEVLGAQLEADRVATESVKKANATQLEIIEYFGKEKYDAMVNGSVPYAVIEQMYLNEVNASADATSKITSNFRTMFNEIGRGARNAFDTTLWGLPEVANTVNTHVGSALDTIMQKLGIVEKTSGETFSQSAWTFGGVKTGIDETFANAFSDDKGLAKFKKRFNDLFNKSSWTFSGVTDGLSTSFANGFGAVKEIYNDFADTFNEMFKIKGTNALSKLLGNVGGAVSSISLGTLPKFSTGGFPEDGLFWANHTEMVGRFANGKTAVANNDQIVSGISKGVYNAVTEAMRGNNSGGDMVINIDGREVFRVVRKHANDYTRQTNKPAFNS